MKYYTTVFYFHTPVQRHLRPNQPPDGSYLAVRALAFVDTENPQSLADVLPVARLAFSSSRNEGQPFFAVLSRPSGAPEGLDVWFATGGFHARSADTWNTHQELFVFDDLYAEDAPRVARIDEAFDACPSLFRFSDGCPCPIATEYVRDEEGVGDYPTKQCGIERVWPLVRKEVYSGRTAEHLRRFNNIPERLSAYVGAYQHLPRRWLLDEPFAYTEAHLDELCVPDLAAIEEHRSVLRDNAALAAKTRRFRKTECAACEFTKCRAWGTRRCTGQKSLKVIREYLGGEPLGVPDGFTEQQRNALMRYASRHRTLTAYGLTSTRKRGVTLGYFTEAGGFQLFSAPCKTEREAWTVWSWKELVETVPEIADWNLAEYAASGVSEGALRIYGLIAQKRWRRFLTGWGRFQHDLKVIAVRDSYGAPGGPQFVRCEYTGGRNWFEFCADGSDEKALFQLLRDDSEGCVIPT